MIYVFFDEVRFVLGFGLVVDGEFFFDKLIKLFLDVYFNYYYFFWFLDFLIGVILGEGLFFFI